MDDVSRLTDGTGVTASETRGNERTCPENEESSEDLLLLRNALICFLGHSPEFLEELLRRHATCDSCRLWHELREEILRARRGSLIEFYFQCYRPALYA